MMQFILFFILSWWLVQFILLFILNSPGAILSFSSYCPGAIHPILQIVLVQNSQRGNEFNQFCPPSSSDVLCFLFCLYPSIWFWPITHESTASSRCHTNVPERGTPTSNVPERGTPTLLRKKKKINKQLLHRGGYSLKLNLPNI